VASKAFVFVLSSALFFSSFAAAEEGITIGDFSAPFKENLPAGWQLKEKTGKADVSQVKADGLSAVHFRSSNSSFALQKEVKVDLKRYPVLTWKWKTTVLPKGGDFRRSKTDDQAAQLFLTFSKTRAIVYLWDTTAPQGSIGNAAAPVFMSIKAVVVQSGNAESGKWVTETRNVYDDYIKLFKKEPPEVKGIRLQINSQHTQSSAESFFADVVFSKN
jgi:hypothetical protein